MSIGEVEISYLKNRVERFVSERGWIKDHNPKNFKSLFPIGGHMLPE